MGYKRFAPQVEVPDFESPSTPHPPIVDHWIRARVYDEIAYQLSLHTFMWFPFRFQM